MQRLYVCNTVRKGCFNRDLFEILDMLLVSLTVSLGIAWIFSKF